MEAVVSHHVAALEREFGLTLVNRGTRPVSITDAGERLLRHAEAVLGEVTAAEDELRAIAGLQSGTLRVGAFLSACNSFLPSALARFEEDHPEVEVSFEQLEEPAALRRIRSGDLDVAVVWRIPGFPGPGANMRDVGFNQLHLVDDPYLVVLPAKHRLARRSQVRLADLANERFTAPPAAGHALPYREMLERLCAEAGFEPRIHQAEGVTVARAIITAGLSVGLLSELTMPEPRLDIALRPPATSARTARSTRPGSTAGGLQRSHGWSDTSPRQRRHGSAKAAERGLPTNSTAYRCDVNGAQGFYLAGNELAVADVDVRSWDDGRQAVPAD